MLAPLAVTMGEPAGIGGEITILAWRKLRAEGPVFFAVDDPARLTALGAPVQSIRSPDEAALYFAKALPVLPVSLAVPATLGQPDLRNARAVIDSIKSAVRFAREKTAAGMVTNPIHKATLYAAGFDFPGHTEFLGALTGVSNPVMMLVNPYLRVVPVTIHVPLRRAIEMLSADMIVAAATIAGHALRRDFGIAKPRLAVAGLNPHAGEGGSLGDEEQRIITPAIAALRERGFDVSGPHPADTMFTATRRTRYDVAICHYHDQALIPLKTLDVAQGVNVTIGLPIVRTSPDHGTALDIAGKGEADPASLIAAIRLAAAIAQERGAYENETAAAGRER